jgi:hypothetical protein
VMRISGAVAPFVDDETGVSPLGHHNKLVKHPALEKASGPRAEAIAGCRC